MHKWEAGTIKNTARRIPFSLLLHLLPPFSPFLFLIAYPINIRSPPFVIAAPGGGIVRVLHVSSK